jgi:hypothetical protein
MIYKNTIFKQNDEKNCITIWLMHKIFEIIFFYGEEYQSHLSVIYPIELVLDQKIGY